MLCCQCDASLCVSRDVWQLITLVTYIGFILIALSAWLAGSPFETVTQSVCIGGGGGLLSAAKEGKLEKDAGMFSDLAKSFEERFRAMIPDTQGLLKNAGGRERQSKPRSIADISIADTSIADISIAARRSRRSRTSADFDQDVLPATPTSGAGAGQTSGAGVGQLPEPEAMIELPP